VSTELAPMQAFTEKLQDKIRNDIAGMLPDDIIKAMVEKATHSLFFDRTKRNVGSDYNPAWKYEPSVFEQLVAETVKPIIEEKIREQIATHKDTVEATIKKAVEDGMSKLAFKYLNDVLFAAMTSNDWNFQNAVMNTLRQNGVIRS